MNDSQTSPILRTIYDSRKKSAEEQDKITNIRKRDNTIFIAVNDQQPDIVKKQRNVVKKRSKSNGASASEDDDPDVIKSGSRDAFNLPVDSSCGHVKFFTSAQVEFNPWPSLEAKVYSYLIQHSLPEFPNIPWNSDGRVRRNSLPTDPASIFSENATKSFSKGQHFMCMSFEDKEDLDPEPQRREGGPVLQLKYDRTRMENYLKSKSKHFAVILHYLKTTHASVSSTNYNPHDRDFAVYHQYLNVFSEWSPTEYAESSDNQARTSVDDNAHGDSSHLCPLWPLNLKTKIDGENVATTVTAEYGRKNNLHTMRSSQQVDLGPCRKCRWLPNLGAAGNMDCISSGLLKTTNRQYPLESVLLMKNSIATIAPYDDIISPLVAPISDYANAKDNYVDEDHVESVDMTLIVQSWVDSLTIPEMHRKLMRGHSKKHNQVRLQVNLKITNSVQISLPEISNKGQAGWKHMRSQNVDHSKWALSYPSGRVGTFPKLFCVSDLNRTFKHIKLDNSKDIKRGRGGASICFSGGPLPELMYGLSPKLPDQTDGMYYDNLAPLYAGFKQEMATVVGYSNDGSSLYLMNQLETRPDVVTIYNYSSPVLGVPGQKIPSLPLLKPTDEEYLKIEGNVEFDQAISDVANANELDQEALEEFKRSDFKIGSIFSYPFTKWDYALENEPARAIYKIGFGFWFRLQESFQFAKNAILDLEWYRNILQYLPKPTKKRPKIVIIRKNTLALSDDKKPSGVVQKISIKKPAAIPRKTTVLIKPKGKEIDSEKSDMEATQRDSEDLKGKAARPVSTPPKRTNDRPFQPTILDAPKIQRIRQALSIARRKLEFEDDLIASDASTSEDKVVSSKSTSLSQYSEDNVSFLGSSDEEFLKMPVKTQNKVSLGKGK